MTKRLRSPIPLQHMPVPPSSVPSPCRMRMGPLCSHWLSSRFPSVSRCFCNCAASRGPARRSYHCLGHPMVARGGTLQRTPTWQRHTSELPSLDCTPRHEAALYDAHRPGNAVRRSCSASVALWRQRRPDDATRQSFPASTALCGTRRQSPTSSGLTTPHAGTTTSLVVL